MKKIILFDMDGTLTPARGSMGVRMSYYLGQLQDNSYDIGIVSGSDMEYIEQQCQVLFDISSADWTKIKYFPCNGTKYYTALNNKFKLQYANDMKKAIGNKLYMKIIRDIVDKHSNLVWMEDGDKIPMSGTFIKYRGSMINWCPIGRDSTSEDRDVWGALDKKNNWRNQILSIFNRTEDYKEITFKLGGDTSFDIYPTGWDKTLALEQVKKEGYEEIYFIGDRCEENGNDHEIFEACGDKAYKTKSPEDTVDIIKNILGYNNE